MAGLFRDDCVCGGFYEEFWDREDTVVGCSLKCSYPTPIRAVIEGMVQKEVVDYCNNKPIYKVNKEAFLVDFVNDCGVQYMKGFESIEEARSFLLK